MKNNLTWVVIVLLIVGQGYLYTQQKKVESEVMGTLLFVTLTNPNAQSFVTEFSRVSQIKDKSARETLQQRTMNKYNPALSTYVYGGETNGSATKVN